MALFARAKTPTIYRAFLRGRLRGAGILPDAEAKLYADPELPTQLLVGFVLGALAAVEAPLPGEAEVVAEVARRLLPAEAPASTPPAVPAAVEEDPTERVRPAAWVGEPLPSVGQ